MTKISKSPYKRLVKDIGILLAEGRRQACLCGELNFTKDENSQLCMNYPLLSLYLI